MLPVIAHPQRRIIPIAGPAGERQLRRANRQALYRLILEVINDKVALGSAPRAVRRERCGNLHVVQPEMRAAGLEPQRLARLARDVAQVRDHDPGDLPHIETPVLILRALRKHKLVEINCEIMPDPTGRIHVTLVGGAVGLPDAEHHRRELVKLHAQAQ